MNLFHTVWYKKGVFNLFQILQNFEDIMQNINIVYRTNVSVLEVSDLSQFLCNGLKTK